LNEERWQRLKTVTWFREEQDEVTAYVEELRAAQERERRILSTLTTLLRGISPTTGELVAELDARGGSVPHADFGEAADTVEKRARLLLETIRGERVAGRVEAGGLLGERAPKGPHEPREASPG
jgi:hypothetical protein